MWVRRDWCTTFTASSSSLATQFRQIIWYIGETIINNSNNLYYVPGTAVRKCHDRAGRNTQHYPGSCYIVLVQRVQRATLRTIGTYQVPGAFCRCVFRTNTSSSHFSQTSTLWCCVVVFMHSPLACAFWASCFDFSDATLISLGDWISSRFSIQPPSRMLRTRYPGTSYEYDMINMISRTTRAWLLSRDVCHESCLTRRISSYIMAP